MLKATESSDVGIPEQIDSLTLRYHLELGSFHISALPSLSIGFSLNIAAAISF